MSKDELRRHRNVEWILPEAMTWANVPAALLMDIRDELRWLRRLLSCPGFMEIPDGLRRIERNTRKVRRKVRKKAKRRVKG